MIVCIQKGKITQIDFHKTLFYEEMFLTPSKYRDCLCEAILKQDSKKILSLAKKFNYKISFEQ